MELEVEQRRTRVFDGRKALVEVSRCEQAPQRFFRDRLPGLVVAGVTAQRAWTKARSRAPPAGLNIVACNRAVCSRPGQAVELPAPASDVADPGFQITAPQCPILAGGLGVEPRDRAARSTADSLAPASLPCSLSGARHRPRCRAPYREQLPAFPVAGKMVPDSPLEDSGSSSPP